MSLNVIYDAFVKKGKVSTDSRNIPEGAVFFALKGPSFDGNEYAFEALEKGASLAVVDNPNLKEKPNVCFVDDALTALQALATHHRLQMNATVIGLTGSNGKTTTKELMYAVLRQHANTLATEGNLNNHIGVPLSLLKMTSEHRFAIIEMGANGIGQIAELSSFALPDYGYITNFGKAHLEGFGSKEGVIQGKSELYEQLRSNDGVALVNSNDPTQMQRSSGLRRITFGSSHADVVVQTGVNDQGFVYVDVEGHRITTQLTGAYNATNAAAAVALGVSLNVPVEKIKASIEGYEPRNNRSQWVNRGGVRIMLDAYNANPDSVEAALVSFAKHPGVKWVALGDMLELGAYAEAEHKRIAELATTLGFDRILLVGPIYKTTTGLPDGVEVYSSTEEVKKAFENHPQNVSLLLKGSRGMAMESLLTCFE